MYYRITGLKGSHPERFMLLIILLTGIMAWALANPALASGKHNLSLIVENPAGEVIPGAEVTLGGEEVTTGIDGKAAFSGLDPGTHAYQVEVPWTGYTPVEGQAVIEGEDLTKKVTVDWPYPLSDDFEGERVAPYWSFSGTGGAPTWGLTGDYSYQGEQSMTSSPLGFYNVNEQRVLHTAVNLSRARQPLLSFWQRYNLGEGDYVRVEVSVDNESWRNLYVARGMELNWHQVKIDLSSYYGYGVMYLRFRLFSGASDNKDGWYLDNIKIEDVAVEPAFTLPFLDDAEGEESEGWWYSADWERVPGEVPGEEGGLVWEHKGWQLGGYSYLTSARNIDLRGASRPQLVYWERVVLAHYGRFRVQVSTNNGAHWTTVREVDTGWSSSIPWRRVQIDLSPYRGQLIRVRFFNTPSTHGGNHWQIDGIALSDDPGGVFLEVPERPVNRQLELRWSPYEGREEFLRYELWRSQQPGLTSGVTLVASLEDKQETSFLDTGLALDRVYYYRVFVVSREGVYSGSNEVWGNSGHPYITEFPYREDFSGDLESLAGHWDLTEWGLTGEDPHSGEQCLADSPGEVYGDNQDKRLTSIVDLRQARMPLLSFWHRHIFMGSGDYGVFEISEDRGESWTRLFATGGIQQDWREVRVDLTPYAGRSHIWFRFRMITDGDGAVADGWFIDDVKIEETALPLLGYPFIDDGEGELGRVNWVSSRWILGREGAYQGEKGWSLSHRNPLRGPYALTLAGNVDLGDARDPRLVFWERGTNYYGYKSLSVQVSTNNGITWTEIGAVNSNGNWNRRIMDLSAYRGSRVRLRFVAAASYDGDFRLDNFSIAEHDEEPPDRVGDLRIKEKAARSVTLQWTSVGDDGYSGQAHLYDLRYSTGEITADNFDQAKLVRGLSRPKPAGSGESFSVTGLLPGQTYYFALKTGDKVIQWGAMSNVVSTTTPGEARAGATLVSLVMETDPPGQTQERLREARVGEEFHLIVRVDQVQELNAASYVITYDPQVLEYKGIASLGEGNWGTIGQVSLPAGTVNVDQEEGIIRVAQDITDLGVASGSGFLCKVLFQAREGEREPTRVDFSCGGEEDGEGDGCVLSNPQDNPIASDWQGVDLWRVRAYSGDANDDQKINAQDITWVKRIIVGLEDKTEGADANRDGKVNALDITRIKRIILGLLD